MTASPLRAALDDATGGNNRRLGKFTVLDADNDPFRLDTPAKHRDGQWLAEQAEALGFTDRTVHIRGLHYAVLGRPKPDGTPYENTIKNWEWLAGDAAKAARFLGYIPFERITDQRNAEPVVRVRGTEGPRAYLTTELNVTIPRAWELEPKIDVDGFDGTQPYRLALVGEKSSLEPVLGPIASTYDADLFLPTGEISDTQIYLLAKAAQDDGRPLAVLYFADCDPGGWQMSISVARKLQAFKTLLPKMPDFELHRVALTPEWVSEYNRTHDEPLPSSPLKETETRGDKWRAAWGIEQTEIDSLQEFFGYVLSGRTDLHKIMLLIGPTRSGKGTIARVLTAMVGKGNAAGPTLASLGTNFGLSPLLGKPLAIVSDARLGGASVHQVVERLLSVSGEDMLTVDRKYREPWTGKLPSRFLVLSNELPRFGDASGAISHRFVVLTMAESFLGRENTRLTADLLGELPGILSWALDGLDRLTRQGALTEPASSADAIVALQDLVSPVSAFVRDRCRRGGEVPVADLFAEWKSWCEDNGHKAGSAQTLGRDLRAVVPALRVAQPRDESGRQSQRHYIGISLKPAHNGEERVSPRVNEPDPRLTRGDTRTNPLSAGAETKPAPACPRHQTKWGAHKDCPECQALGAA